MSVEAISWALSAPLGKTTKLILVGYGNHAHPDGGEAYPGLPRLAYYARCSRTTARRSRDLLEQDGWIRHEGFGPAGSVKYRLSMRSHMRSMEGVAGFRDDEALPEALPWPEEMRTTYYLGSRNETPSEQAGGPETDPTEGSSFARKGSQNDTTRGPVLDVSGVHPGVDPNRPEPSIEPSLQLPRASAPPPFPRSAESAPSLVAWLEELAAFYGGRLVDAIAADRDGLVQILAREQRATRLELLRWIQTQAPTWGAPNLAAALLANDRATILRARRDAAGRQAMQSRVAPDLPAFTQSRHLDPISARVARAVSTLPWGDEVELWVLPLAVVGATGHLITLAGPSGLVSGVRARLLPEIQRVLAPTVVELVAGDTTGCLPLSHFVNPESNAA